MIRSISTEFAIAAAPFVLYAAFLYLTSVGVLHPKAWTMRRVSALFIVSLILVIGSFVVLANFSGAPPEFDLRAGASGQRQICSGDDQVTANAHLSDAAWLKSGAVKDLLARLDRDGEEARVVGGAVRNALLDLAVSEVDVATTAVPDEVIRRVEAAGWKAVPTGIEHGTITVVIGGAPFEVTTLRQDIETYGRKAKVVFGRDWIADAQRRDFTVNALSAGADGTVYDYVGGLPDIAARRVRFIGDPAKRIAEDYLRILRFFRFHAWYGAGALDPAGLHACIAAREGLAALSRERVRMELLKLMLAPHATPALAVMAEAGLLGAVLGGVPLSRKLREYGQS